MVRHLTFAALLSLIALGVPYGPLRAAVPRQPHNIVLFVPDGLRAGMVTADLAPTMAGIRDQGINFTNSHSLFPTVTTANASAMATGHYLGDTGDFSNTIYSGTAVRSAGDTVTPFLENDSVLGEVDELFFGDYLHETTLLQAAREAGISTAVIGKLGPGLIFDHTDRSAARTIVVDDSTGTPGGIAVSEEFKVALVEAGLALNPPPRGENAKSGNATTPGTTGANVAQQDYFTEVAAKAILPLFKARGRPFVLVVWSRDPDGTQHNQGDSLNALTPGINGPTTLAAIRNADDDLARIMSALSDLGLTDTTDIVISADHGFSTVSKESQSSPSVRVAYADVPRGLLPPGFVAIDLATGLAMPLYDPDSHNAAIAANSHPSRGNGLIGLDPVHPDLVVAANGGSDLLYLPTRDRALAARVVTLLLAQDYVSGLFVDDSLGRFVGTLPLSAINLNGSAVTPHPSIVVNFRSFATGCDVPTNCTAEIADTGLQQGQGIHGSFGRADTMNFMAAVGPDFKKGFKDDAPVSNADVGRTLAHVLGLRSKDRGTLSGRVMSEIFLAGRTPPYKAKIMRSDETASGLRTVLDYQLVGKTRYFDVAGFPGRTFGLMP